jgi:hypothetical protein
MALTANPAPVLRRGILLAKRVEKTGRPTNFKKRVRLVTYGFVLRNRRLASAIERLGTASAYEGRMLLRPMIETLINHAWIKLRWTHSRSTRFVAYQPLELLRVQRSLQTTTSPTEYKATKRQLTRKRAAVRHLFQFKDKNGKLQWARDWAPLSVEARLHEVQRAQNPDDSPDLFLYALYSWFSSGVHGGPNSINEILTRVNGQIFPAKQPERDPKSHMVGAAAVLAHTLREAAEDLDLSDALQADIKNYSAAVRKLRKPKKSS